MTGIKETKDVLVAVNKLAVDTIKAAKDGLDLSDLSVLVGALDEIKNAVEGAGEISAEMKDLSREEAQQLMFEAVAIVFNVLEALKNDKVA